MLYFFSIPFIINTSLPVIPGTWHTTTFQNSNQYWHYNNVNIGMTVKPGCYSHCSPQSLWTVCSSLSRSSVVPISGSMREVWSSSSPDCSCWDCESVGKTIKEEWVNMKALPWQLVWSTSGYRSPHTAGSILIGAGIVLQCPLWWTHISVSLIIIFS